MRRNRILRTTLVAVAVLAGVSGLAGCKIPGLADKTGTSNAASAGAVELSPQQLVSEATKKSQDASTASFTMSMVLATGGENIRMYAVGQMDDAAQAMSMTMKMRMPGVGALKTRTRVVDGTYYMSGIHGAGRKWVKLDATQAKEFQQGAASNPADQLAVFEKLSDGVTKVGPATVRGVATTKYSGTLNMSKPATADESPALTEARKDFADAGLTSVPFTYFIDDNGLLARMSMSMDMKGDSAAETGKMILAMNFSRWGEPVSITAPPNPVTLASVLGTSSAA